MIKKIFVKYDIKVNKKKPYNPVKPIFASLLYWVKYLEKMFPYPIVEHVKIKYTKINSKISI